MCKAWGQTNPAAFDLSSGSFSFTTQTATNTTYPTNMQGWATSANNIATAETTAPSADYTLIASGTNTTSGLSNLGSSGFQFISTGSGTPRRAGEICVSLNTTNRTNVLVTWTASDQQSGANYYSMGLALQYRVGTTGIFTAVGSTLYTSSVSAAAAAQTFTNIALPAACENQAVVQIRWIYYEISASGASGRDPIRLDEITVSSSSNCTAPSTQATSFTSSAITATTMTVGWTRGATPGDAVMVVARAGSAPTDPSSGTTYTASAAYGSGTACGSGFCVYNGTGTSVNLTALTGSTTYYFAIYEYNTTGTCYLMTELAGNASTSVPAFDGTFSGGTSFAANVMTSANAANNYWIVGTATHNGAPNSAYITNNGSANAYTLTSSYISHFYFDYSFPAGQTDITLNFDWKCEGEGVSSDYDNLKVFVAPTTVTPVSGAAVSGTYLVGSPWYNLQSSAWQNAAITLSGTLAGTNGRIIFSWKNDASTGAQPPAAVDNIAITTVTPCYPTTQATLLTTSSVATTSMTVGWTRGNGTNVMVVARAGSAPADPTSGVTYAANTAYGSGDACGSGFVVYNGTGTSVDLTALTSSTTYYYAIYEYNTTGTCYNLVQLTGNATTLNCWPSSQATVFASSLITTTTMTVGWTRGNGTNVMVVARAGSAPTDPTSGVAYTANAAYGSGDACGSGFVVYNGTGTSVDLTALTSSTTYYYAIYEYNTTGTCYNLTQLTGNALTLNCYPSTQATVFASSLITTTTMTVGWTRGNGNNVLVVARAGSAPTDPVSGTTYVANAAYGSGDACGSGFVVYNGTGTSVNLTALTSTTTYYYAIYEYNTTGTCYNLTQLTGNATTLNCWPSTQATSFTSSSITLTSMTVGWTRGNGNSVMVVARAGSAPTDPTSGNTYTANTAYASGSACGGGYVVYNGTGTSVGITNLNGSTTYYFAIYEYNTTGTCYYLTQLTGSELTCLNPVALPQSCNFSSYTGSNLSTYFPLFSEASGATPSGTTSLWSSSTSLGSQTTARINLYANSKNEWIIGPTFTVTDTYVNFYAAITDASSGSADASGMAGTDDKVILRVKPCGGSWTDVYTFQASTTGTLTNVLTQYCISLAAYNGQDVTMAFFASEGTVNDAPDYDFHLDNINIIGSAPACATYLTPSSGTTGICNSTGTTLTWSNVTGASGYKVYLDNNASPTTLVSTSSNATYSTGALTAGLTYYWKIVPVNCIGDATGCSTVWSFSTVGCYNMDNTNISICSGNFYDSGGPGAYYGSSESFTKTITASTAGNVLQVTFSEFDTEFGYDYLYIYDGPTTASAQVTGSPFNGTTIPQSIISSGTTLTFKFTSDGSSTYSGWAATVNCLAACSGTPTAGNAAASITTLCTGSTSNLSLSGNVLAGGLTYQWQSSPDNSTWANIASATSFTYTATVGATTYYHCNVTCTASAITSVSGSVLVTVVECYNMNDTPVTTCAANFYDSGGPASDYDVYDDYTKTFTASTPGSSLQVNFTSFDIDSYDYFFVYDGPDNTYPQVPGSPFTGSSLPSPIVSSGSSLTFYFIADFVDSWCGSGWQAYVSCVTAVPNCVTLSSPANTTTDVCPGNGATLTWTPSATGFLPTSYKLYFGTDNAPTNIVNGTNIGNVTTYETGPLASNTTYYWRIFAVNSIGVNTGCTTTYSFTTQNINITATNSPVTTCENTAALTATGGGTINWYTTPTGGSSIATGSPYNATFSGNTTYYVGASNGTLSNYTTGYPGPASSSFASSSMGIWFDVLSSLTISTVDVYVTTPGTNLTVRLQNSSSIDIQTLAFTNMPAGLNTLTLNFAIATPGTYILLSEDGVSLGYEDTFSGYPYTVPGVISLTSGEWWGIEPTIYGYFYNWKISAGTTCECARVAVNVIHTAPTVTITPNGTTTFMLGSSVDLTASSTASPAYTYTWSPATGLNTSTGATVTATPSTTTTYTVTGTNGTPCTQTAQVTVTVNLPCTGLGTGVTNIASLPYSIAGQTTTGMVNDITSSNAIICSSSSYYTGNDVVYTFTPTISGAITITLTSAGTYTGVMLYSGCPMNGQGGVCVASSQSSTGNKNMCVAVTAGVMYYLVIDSYSFYTSTNPYDLAVSAPDPSSTPNDLPCNADLMNANDLTPGDNSCATGTGEPTPPSCWTNGNINTVWYKLTTGAGQTSIKIKTIVGSLLNTQIAVYSGACGSGMSLVACNDNASACGSSQYNNSELTVSVSPLTTYYVAVDGYSDQTGTFSIVWTDGASTWPAVPGQDCISGVPVCSQTFTIGNPGYQAVGNICDFPGGGTNCLLDGERGSAWYEITVNANGNLMFTIEPNDAVANGAGLLTNDGTDYDFGIWKKTGTGAVTCTQVASGSAPLVCNYSSIGVTGMYTGGSTPGSNAYTSHTYTAGGYDGAFEAPLAVTSGEVYWLVISNFSNSTSGFTINFSSSSNGFNFTVPNPLIWTGGAASTDWFDARNWGNCAVIPTSTIDCIIASASIYQPVINASAAVCKSITINTGATLTINSGRNLEIYGNYNNQGSLNANSASTVTMTGAAAQTMDGIMVTPSEFGNLTITKTAGSVQLNQNTETSAILTTSSSTSILNTNGNYVTVAGNVSLNAPATYIGVGTTGTLEMNGAAAQTITAGGVLSLCNFTMNNTGGGVTTNNDIELNTSGIFTLTNGKISTGINKIITKNTASTSVTNGTSTSFVNGNLRRHFTSNTNTYAFPVGAGTAYRLAEIINDNLTGITYFDSKFSTSFTNTGSLDSTIAFDGSTIYQSICPEGIWQLDPDAVPPTGSYSIKLHFDGGGINAFASLVDNEFGALKRVNSSASASDWTAIGGTLNSTSTIGRTVAGGYAQRTGWTTFSHHGIGKKAPGSLPIELLDFTATYNGKSVDVSWETASEKNNNYFTVERSADAHNYSFIAKVVSKALGGNSTSTLNYAIADEGVEEGNIYYYRLKQTDFDGTSTNSEIAYVKIDDDELFTLKPNPTSATSEISYQCFAAEVAYLKVYDYRGRLVISKNMECSKGFNSSLIDLSDQPDGVFFVTLTANNKVYKSKLLKSK